MGGDASRAGLRLGRWGIGEAVFTLLGPWRCCPSLSVRWPHSPAPPVRSQVSAVDRSGPTVMCLLALGEALTQQWGAKLAAERVLPVLCPLLVSPALSAKQAAAAARTVRETLATIERARSPGGGAGVAAAPALAGGRPAAAEVRLHWPVWAAPGMPLSPSGATGALILEGLAPRQARSPCYLSATRPPYRWHTHAQNPSPPAALVLQLDGSDFHGSAAALGLAGRRQLQDLFWNREPNGSTADGSPRRQARRHAQRGGRCVCGWPKADGAADLLSARHAWPKPHGCCSQQPVPCGASHGGWRAWPKHAGAAGPLCLPGGASAGRTAAAAEGRRSRSSASSIFRAAAQRRSGGRQPLPVPSRPFRCAGRRQPASGAGIGAAAAAASAAGRLPEQLPHLAPPCKQAAGRVRARSSKQLSVVWSVVCCTSINSQLRLPPHTTGSSEPVSTAAACGAPHAHTSSAAAQQRPPCLHLLGFLTGPLLKDHVTWMG